MIFTPGCTAEQFACSDLKKCISKGKSCDSNYDCDDDSDELPKNIDCCKNPFFIRNIPWTLIITNQSSNLFTPVLITYKFSSLKHS